MSSLWLLFFFARNFRKDNKEEDRTKEPVITQEEEQTKEEPNVEEGKEDPNKPTDPDLQEYLEEDQLENIDDSLYEEDAGDTYQRK